MSKCISSAVGCTLLSDGGGVRYAVTRYRRFDSKLLLPVEI